VLGKFCAFLEKVGLAQLLDAEPDYILVYGSIDFSLNRASYLCY